MNNQDNNVEYKQVCFVGENDTRSVEERMKDIPFIRDEDLPEWESWWERTFFGI
jgi:hypothetical protein